MNKIKRIACAVLAGILLCGALAFAAQTRGQEMRDAPIRTIELEVENPVLVEMKIGEQVQLVLADTAADSDTGSQGSGTQQPSEGTWNSEQPDIVSVDENGLLTAKAEGTAVISKSVPQGVVSCEVTVKGYQVTGLELTAETEMRVGQTQTVRADITPTEAQATLTWSSDNTDVVTVNANGDVTAVGTGRATIAAETEDGLQAFLVITVEGYVIESLSIEPSAIDLYVGDSQAITVQAKPEGSDPGELTWKFSDASIAYYRDGNIYAASAGEATITATNADGVQAQCNVTVHNTSLSLNQTTATLQAGKTVQLQATVTPAGRTVEWSSDNAAVARVDQNGVVTGVKAGTAKITAKINGAEAVCQVTVTETSSNNPSNPS
ncbi:MAG: Ig-like domain-containing protein, partial [Eubacteriales bacterium]|nr:Ig-like domain-containing protein [Eubacteriales bacterium]